MDVSDKVFFLMETLRKRFPSPDLDDLYAGISQATNMTGFTSWYPWNIFYQRGIEDLDFESITIFYGGNGSGKTTLLNVIAQKLNLQRSTLYNRSPFFDDYLKFCDYYLSKNPDSEGAIQRGHIITSDDVFDNMLKLRYENQYIDHKRDLLVEQYMNRPIKLKSDPSCSRFVRSQLRNNQAEQSNGETAFNYFVNAIKDNTLILLDEPENSLSAQWQMELALFLQGAIRSFNCQLIIASHSPFILSIPGARIYNLDVTPIEIDKWYNLNNIRCYFDLFKQHEAYFEK
ncbi:AAA family ATPase [Eubacterium ventriosum]|uniref:AAA family ATPase n=1 Tax=Eubacterium ventriosum TaxID=39496 RepID=UPI003AB5507A